MNTVLLKSSGEILTDGDRPAPNPLACLGHQVRLGEGYTLRSFFRMIERYPVFSQLNAFLPECLELYRACPGAACLAPGIGRLELTKTVEMTGFPGAPRLEIYPGLGGVCGAAPCEIRALPLDHLLDLPVAIGKLKHVVFGDRVDVLECDTVFNLFEFIEGIAWQLSFHRSPKACALPA
jgi:hypothetical protein